MSKYIKLEDAIRVCQGRLMLANGAALGVRQPTPEENITALSDLPTIDIVHCEDCKFKRLYDDETKYFYCALENRPNRNWSVDDWDFCSWGEREDNE